MIVQISLSYKSRVKVKINVNDCIKYNKYKQILHFHLTFLEIATVLLDIETRKGGTNLLHTFKI